MDRRQIGGALLVGISGLCAIGGGIGATQGRTAEGAAIGAGAGMLYDITR